MNRDLGVASQLLGHGRIREVGIETTDPKTLLPHVRDSLPATMPKMVIAVDVADDVPPLKADCSQLEMMLINLANNVRDAMNGMQEQFTLSAGWSPEIPSRPDLMCPRSAAPGCRWWRCSMAARHPGWQSTAPSFGWRGCWPRPVSA